MEFTAFQSVHRELPRLSIALRRREIFLILRQQSFDLGHSMRGQIPLDISFFDFFKLIFFSGGRGGGGPSVPKFLSEVCKKIMKKSRRTGARKKRRLGRRVQCTFSLSRGSCYLLLLQCSAACILPWVEHFSYPTLHACYQVLLLPTPPM